MIKKQKNIPPVLNRTRILFTVLVLALGAITRAQAFTHPSVPFTPDDLNTLKANLNTEPWKSGYAAPRRRLALTDHHLAGNQREGLDERRRNLSIVG
jgi:hypothetical protein